MKVWQIEILPESGQHKPPTVLAEFVTAAVGTLIVVVGDDLDIDDVVAGLGATLNEPKGLIMFPSWSISTVKRLK